jgi:hypothetical protein
MKRILACLFLIVVLPLANSASSSRNGPMPFASVALAGHTNGSAWCECGAPGCICDPGELQGLRSAALTPTQPVNPVDRNGTSSADLGSGMLAFALALLLWFRMRR